MSTTTKSIDPFDLRKAFGVFATGVTVVTTVDGDGNPRGFTANSFTSVSLEPPLVLVCIGRQLRVAPVFLNTSHFAINILSSEQSDVSAAFGSPAGKRFEAVHHHPGTSGSPIITDVAAWLDCRMHDTIEQGDHVILVGEVLAYEYTPVPPLGYCRGAYVTFGLAQEALRAAQRQQPVVVSAIVEYRESVLLIRDGDRYRFPSAAKFGSADEPESLVGGLVKSGLEVELPFVFAVFEDKADGTQNIVYRGEAVDVSKAMKPGFVPFDDIPWDRLIDDATRSMVKRYIKERREELFGVYVGDMDSGVIRTITD